MKAKKKAHDNEFFYVEFTRPWIHSHQLEGCNIDDPKAHIFFSSGGDKKPYSAGYYATDNYACDLRVKATKEILHHANWREKRHATPTIPETAMFVARACEIELSQRRKR